MLIAKVNLTSSDGTEQKAQLGSVYESNGCTWVYCLATAVAISAYSVCSGTLAAGPGAVAAATTTTATALGTSGGFACIPQFDVGASEYFWGLTASINGVIWDNATTTKVLAANVTAGNLLYSTATAGVLDDDSAGSTIPLIGGILVTTVTTQAATAFKTLPKGISWAK
jgi:hypothetical protein